MSPLFRFSLASLRTRIALIMMGVSVLTTGAILLYEQQASVKSMTQAQEESALNLLNTVLLSIESQYHSILFHKRASMEKRKAMLRSVIDLARSQLIAIYDEAQAGQLTQDQAQLRAIEALRRMRYDNKVGYLWINSIDLPAPKMIMHATLPELEGQFLDAPRFNCALGRDENLFRAMVDVCLKEGHGYVDYLWPKPSPTGLKEREPKLSYVELFQPWGWVIGTGLYIDDIERDAAERLAAVLEELEVSLSNVKVAQTGYLFLFDSDQNMLIHPSLAGADFSKLPNPETGNPVLEDLMVAAHSPSKKLIYTWDKPPAFAGEFRFKKIAFVQYFQPLNWYIASSIYDDEMRQPAIRIRQRVVLLGGVLLIVSLALSLLLAKSLVQPLRNLSFAAKSIHGEESTHDRVPVGGTIETQELGKVLNSMLSSLQGEFTERRQAEATLKAALQEKEVLLREVHHRVKNNLAVVVSLLSMQAKKVDDKQVRTALDESRARIAAMSLIHENLYRSDNFAEIPLKTYVKTLYHSLLQAMLQGPGRRRLSIGGQEVRLTIEQAVPCALILNELFTNTLKYAYPNAASGTIRIRAKITPDNWLLLAYRDDGVGLPEGFAPEKMDSLGMRIVRLLVENQLGGMLAWASGPGAQFYLTWPLSELDAETEQL